MKQSHNKLYLNILALMFIFTFNLGLGSAVW
jgi:hypothetical protein